MVAAGRHHLEGTTGRPGVRRWCRHDLRRRGGARCQDSTPARHQQPRLRPVGATTRPHSRGGVGQPRRPGLCPSTIRLHPQPGPQQRPGRTDQLACSPCSGSSSTMAWTSSASPAARRSSSRCSADDPLFDPARAARPDFIIANRTIVDRGISSRSTPRPRGSTRTRPTPPPPRSRCSCVSTSRIGGRQAPVERAACSTGCRRQHRQLGRGQGAGRRPSWASQLVDTDIFNVPLLLTDEYGRFLRGPNGFPQMVRSRTAPSTRATHRAGHDCVARRVVDRPRLPGRHRPRRGARRPRHRSRPASTRWATRDPRTYDDELLDAHFITGDGRGNENIGLTAIHTMFHSEHNRLVDDINGIVDGDRRRSADRRVQARRRLGRTRSGCSRPHGS